jgi:uncharacterized membrane protein
MALQQVQNNNTRLTLASPLSKQALERTTQRFGEFLLNYWAHIITAVLGLLVATALSIPFLSYFGLDAIAKPLFFSLHFVCAQIPSHSFYIFGHQLGLCARNFSIYTSMFIGSLIFVLSKKRLPGIPWWIWVLMILPMALDGITQMFGLRESTWVLRVITGTLFGLGNIWFVLPFIQKTLDETPPVRRPAPYKGTYPQPQTINLDTSPGANALIAHAYTTNNVPKAVEQEAIKE